MLRELQNFSTAEIATILNRKEATIRWRLSEARTLFHDLWVKRRDGEVEDKQSRADEELPKLGNRKGRKGKS